MNYNWNIKDIALNMVPRVLRKERFNAFVAIMVKPAQSLNDVMSLFIDKCNRRIKFNSQTIYLEKLLNDQFDNSLRRIQVVTTIQAGDVLLSNASEGIAPVYIYNADEPSIINYFFNANEEWDHEFEVQIPAALSGYNDRITGQVNEVKLAEKRFAIVEI